MILFNKSKKNHSKFRQILCLLTLGSIIALSALSLNAMGGMSIFEGPPTEEACRNCHEDLENFPMLERRNPDKHHLLVTTPIPPLEESKAPDAPGGIPGENYECMACHEVDRDVESQAYILVPFRDCLLCHPESVVTGSPMMGTNVHHKTETFLQGDCQVCHGGSMCGNCM